KLASDTIEGFRRKGIIKNFLADSLAPERDVDVQQVIIEPMEKAPYKATVDFFEMEYSPADHSIVKRTLYTASILFTFREHVPNEDILVNPLGLAITYFREDEAFLK
ncbi:MAG: VirB8/TrbF family protein, partial [Candidatus Acidiferrum sp.]